MFRRATLAVSELALFILMLGVLFGCQAKQAEELTDAAPASQETKTSTTAANTGAPKSTMDAKLIPRDVLFGNPQKAQARLSPDGKYLSFPRPSTAC